MLYDASIKMLNWRLSTSMEPPNCWQPSWQRTKVTWSGATTGIRSLSTIIVWLTSSYDTSSYDWHHHMIDIIIWLIIITMMISIIITITITQNHNSNLFQLFIHGAIPFAVLAVANFRYMYIVCMYIVRIVEENGYSSREQFFPQIINLNNQTKKAFSSRSFRSKHAMSKFCITCFHSPPKIWKKERKKQSGYARVWRSQKTRGWIWQILSVHLRNLS